MGEVALKQSGILTPSNMTEAEQFAKTIAVSSFCPKTFQGKPADIVVAVQWASEVGLSPLTAMQKYGRHQWQTVVIRRWFAGAHHWAP